MLLFVTTGGASPGTFLFTAYMNITGIGNFMWNFTGLPSANLPPGEHAFVVGPGQTVKVTIPFKIPADAQPREYQYSATLLASEGGAPFGYPLTVRDSLTVVPAGATPPPVQGLSGTSLFLLLVSALGVELLGLLVARIYHWTRPPKPVSPEVASIKRRTKILTRLSLVGAVVFLVMTILPHLWNGPLTLAYRYVTLPSIFFAAALACILGVAISSVSGALVRDGRLPLTNEIRVRQALGFAIMVLILFPVLSGWSFQPLEQLPEVVFMVALFVPRAYPKKATAAIVFLAGAYAVWPGAGGTGPFGPALSDLPFGWWSPFASRWSLGDLLSAWSLLAEKAIAVAGFAWLLVRRHPFAPSSHQPLTAREKQ